MEAKFVKYPKAGKVNGEWKLVGYYNYAFNAYGNSIIIERDGVKKVFKVVEDNDFVVKVQKTQVKATGGAEGLYKFFARESAIGSSLAKIWMDKIFDNTKERKF